MLKNKLISLLAKTDLALTADQIDKLILYVNLLHKWNKAYNLTSVRDPQEMLVKHIMDSLAVSPYLQGYFFIDVGTGAGLPGIPLAIINPDKHFYLVDSLGKRIRFLKQVQFELGLTNITPIQSRIEKFNDEKFDGVISRAFASIQDMLTWCQHLTNETGKFYALKGVYPEDEIKQLANNTLNIINLNVPELVGDRHLVIISK